MPDLFPLQGELDAATQTFDTVQLFLVSKGIPPFFARYVSSTAATVVLLGSTLLAVLLGLIRVIGIPFAVAMLQLIDKVRHDNPEGMAQVTTAAMSEFLGTEITADDLPTGKSAADVAARMNALGTKLHALLRSEFKGSAPITPEEGAANAATFSGYNMNFSTSSALISILGEMVSLGQLKQIRELGVELAENLGLGRLHRQAMQPLIRNIIALPYDRYLRKQYRPDKLTAPQYLTAFRAGRMDEQTMRDNMAELGYASDLIDGLMKQYEPDLYQTDLVRLVRYGEMTQEAATQTLMDRGWSKEYAEQRLRSALLNRVDATVDTIVSEQRAKVLDGFLSLDDFRAQLQSLPLLDAEITFIMRDIGLRLETPRSTLTWAQVKTGFKNGILDFDYVDQFLSNQGYSDTDTLALEMELLKEYDDKTTADQAKAAKAAAAAAKAAKGTTPQTPPTTGA